MAIRDEFLRESEAVAELTTAVLRGQLKGIDAAGDVVTVPAISLDTITGTLYDLATGQILNGFEDVDLLSDARASIDASGNLVVILEPADSPIVDAASTVNLAPKKSVPGEKHLLLITFTWNGGTRTGRHEWLFQVVNLTKVPASP